MGDKFEFIAAVLEEVEEVAAVEVDGADMDAYLDELRERVQQARRYVQELKAEYGNGEDDR
jgi:hypothetical protein